VAATAAAAAPPPAQQALGELFAQYRPGTPSDMFAPAYIKGYSPSEYAVSQWQVANRGTTDADVEASRMPSEYRDQSVTGASDHYGGGRIPLNIDYTGKGAVDPEALRALSQGGRYDLNARRNAIAARLAANLAAQTPVPLEGPNPYEGML
jgi:hypothetical protein